MCDESVQDVTRLLEEFRAGDETARDKVFLIVRDELRRMASQSLQKVPNQTLQPTELVNELYLRWRLRDDKVFQSAPNRVFLLAAAGRGMYDILVERARKRRTQREGGGWVRSSLDVVLDSIEDKMGHSYLDLHEAIEGLRQEYDRKARVIVLRYFSGLTVAEIAEVERVSVGTVERDQNFAQAWLKRRLEGDHDR